ncbi:MAG: tetratricopeptide repeat protein [Candidatus Hermodarchaeota archaeon]
MAHLIHKELGQAEKLIEAGKIEEALQILNDFKNKKDLSYRERIAYYCLKGFVAFYFQDRNECTKYTEKAYRESQKLENSILLLDVYILMGAISNWSYKTNEAAGFIKKSEDLLKILPQELSTELKKRKAYILWNKGAYHEQKGDLEKAKEFREESLVILEDLNLKVDIALMHYQLGVISWKIGNLNCALEYIKSCKNHCNKLDLIDIFHYCNLQFGMIYTLKGELDKALSYYEQILSFTEKENKLELLSPIYNSIGMTYHEKGDYDNALKFLKKSITIAEEYGTIIQKFAFTDSLFQLALDMNDLEQAQRWLNRMKQISDQEKNQSNYYNILYNIDRAIYLKSSPRAVNRGKAEEMLKQLIEEEISDFESLKMALLNLCDLLLFELYATNEPEILDELQVYISQLFDTVKNSRSYSLLAETYLLQARLSLITLDIKKARQLLIKAQEIADNYGLNRLAIKISNEHDELLKQLDVWNKLKESKAPLYERLELASPNEQMERMIRKREIIVPELTDEEPIVLLIISEGGRPLFSNSFAEEWAFEDHLFGGFLTAINSFSDQMFSEGLNRANFGEYTIIMNSLHPFLVCYLFKGQSYLAQQRVAKFIDNVKQDATIWKTFNEYNQTSRLVQLKDIPSLEPLINEIFAEKTIRLN